VRTPLFPRRRTSDSARPLFRLSVFARSEGTGAASRTPDRPFLRRTNGLHDARSGGPPRWSGFLLAEGRESTRVRSGRKRVLWEWFRRRKFGYADLNRRKWPHTCDAVRQVGRRWFGGSFPHPPPAFLPPPRLTNVLRSCLPNDGNHDEDRWRGAYRTLGSAACHKPERQGAWRTSIGVGCGPGPAVSNLDDAFETNPRTARMDVR